MKVKRIAVFFQHPWLETLPFIREPITALAREDFEIDVYSPVSSEFPKICFNNEKIRHIQFDFKFSKKTFFLVLKRMLIESIKNRYCLYIANPDGALILGAVITYFLGKPLIAFCDEIEMMYGFRKRSLTWSYQRSRFIVITDRSRIPFLESTLPFLGNLRYFELPNCSAAMYSRSSKLKSKVELKILNLGYFNENFGSQLILDALQNIQDPNVFFVIHERSTRKDINDSRRLLLRLIEKAYPISFCTDPLPYDDLDEVLQEVDIGLALYISKDINVDLCGKGSGKLARYLKNGKPVIVAGGNMEWLVEYGAAEYASSGSELWAAISKIRANYESYVNKALECYQEQFSFERYFEPICLEIIQMVKYQQY